jgi:metal-responsive CopG/Arc/MetJ family transcriptional regulator
MEELETKNVGVAITDETDGKLDKIMEAKKFKNRADAVEWLIQETFKLLFKGGS